MITIWNTPIVATVEQIVKDLKLELYSTGLLKDINNTGSDVMVTCPFHKNGKERKPSCGISLKEKRANDKHYEAGTVHCYTCGYTSDLPTFLKDLLDLKDSYEGFKYLVGKYNLSTSEREPIELDLSRGEEVASVTYDLSTINEFKANLWSSERALNYLKGRCISEEVMKEYELGYDLTDDTVLFPVFDIKGEVVFYKGRSITGKQFYNSKGVDKTNSIYGLYQLLKSTNKDEGIWITESEIDALTLISKGEKAIAIMGSHISDTQCRTLENTPYRKFIIATDNDEAGRKGAFLLKQKLIPKGFRFTNLAWNTSIKDINDLIKKYGDSYKDYLQGF